MKNLFDCIVESIGGPVIRHFSLFISFLLLIVVADEIEILSKGYYPFGIYIFICGILSSWCFVCIINLVKIAWLQKIIVALFSVITIIGFVTDILCLSVFQTRFNIEFAATVIGTNPSEMTEFFQTYISFHFCILVVLLLLVIYAIYRTLKRVLIPDNKYLKKALFLFFVISSLLVFRNRESFSESLLGKYSMFFSISSPPNLRDFKQNPCILVDKNGLPSKVVIIIGESFSKSHSSLYGYPIRTNPLLERLEKEESIIVYDNVIAAALKTAPAFKCIMSTYSPEMEDSINWYECLTLPEIASRAGFKTCWLSNQRKLGLWENIIGKYSELCDTSFFVSDKFSSIKIQEYDEELFPLLDKALQLFKCEPNSFFFIHLMGSHVAFEKRYPQKFQVFKSSNYIDYPEWQRDRRAAYDNSILYNDYVVSEIIKRFVADDALVFYFPDHGLDIFDSSPHYCSHAIASRPASKEAGESIPFVVYRSKSFQDKFSMKSERIKKSKENIFRTDNVIYSIMDILDLQFCDTIIPYDKSLFHNSDIR